MWAPTVLGSPAYLSLVSIPIIKTTTKSNLDRKGFHWLTQPNNHSPPWIQSRNSRQELCRAHHKVWLGCISSQQQSLTLLATLCWFCRIAEYRSPTVLNATHKSHRATQLDNVWQGHTSGREVLRNHCVNLWQWSWTYNRDPKNTGDAKNIRGPSARA